MGDIITDGPFVGLRRNHYKTIYADPAWPFKVWSNAPGSDKRIPSRGSVTPYSAMSMEDIASLPVSDLAAEDCCLFMWFVWPTLPDALKIIERWGFTYKTCAFSWIKADARQIEMFQDDYQVRVGLGFWSRANAECCLLATRGSPKRLNADVRQAIVEPVREHSRKPSVVYERIERLVPGPFLELFARTQRDGWSSWGNQLDLFAAPITAPSIISEDEEQISLPIT